MMNIAEERVVVIDVVFPRFSVLRISPALFL